VGFSRKRTGIGGRVRYTAIYRDLLRRQRSAGSFATRRWGGGTSRNTPVHCPGTGRDLPARGPPGAGRHRTHPPLHDDRSALRRMPRGRPPTRFMSRRGRCAIRTCDVRLTATTAPPAPPTGGSRRAATTATSYAAPPG
jgi:hypothetical protein